MNEHSVLGLTLLNPDLDFSVKSIKLRDDYLFIITENNEILVYIKNEDIINKVSFYKKKFLVLTHPQIRSEIFEIFIMNSANKILVQSEKLIIIISTNLIIYYCNFSDGLCFNKINLSMFHSKVNDGKLIQCYNLNNRFILLFFERKMLIFDTFSHNIIKEEPMKSLIKERGEKQELISFEISKIYQIKSNSFYILSKDNDTYFLSISDYIIDHLNLNFEDIFIKIIKQTFDISKILNEESNFCYFNNQEFLFHNLSQKISVSFLDSVEELTELSYLNSKERFPLIYLSSIIIDKVEYLLTIYKDLTCILFTYDQKIREIKQCKKFIIMIEDEFIHMKYITCNNVLIGYTDKSIHIFDLRRLNKNEEQYADQTIKLNDIFLKNNIFFTNYFCANFGHYVNSLLNVLNNNDNKVSNEVDSQTLTKMVSQDIDNLLSNTNTNNTSIYSDQKQSKSFKITSSIIFSFSDNNSLYYIFGTNKGKIVIIDIFPNENLELNPFLVIDYHQYPIESFSIYENRILIASSSDGTISFTDISLQKLKSAFNSVIINKTEYYDDDSASNILRKNSIHKRRGVDDLANNFSYSYVRKIQRKESIKSNKSIPSIINYENQIPMATLIPIYNIKSFCKLKKIIPVEQLDHTYIDEINQRNKSLLAFEMDDNEIIIMRMDQFKSLYKFNQISNTYQIEAIYHICEQKSLIFYLSNNTIRVSSYATRNCDRLINNIDRIYDILRVDEKLKIYFDLDNNDIRNYYNNENKNSFVSNINKESICMDDSFYTELRSGKINNKDLSNINEYELHQKDLKKQKEQQKFYENLNFEISAKNIKRFVTDEKEKELFTLKLYEKVMNKKQELNSSKSRYEALWMRKVGKLIIDRIIEIVNSDIDEKIQKIKIMNLIFNNQKFIKSDDKAGQCNLKGINEIYMLLGNQYNEIISFHYEDYFLYIEEKTEELKKLTVKERINYFNYISLFHIWNFSLDSDVELYNNYKLYQPVFDFFPVLFGVDSTCTIFLKEEKHVGPNINSTQKFKSHFSFFKKYITIQKTKQKEELKHDKNELFLNKVLLLESHQSYIVNLKNYKSSQNLSHHLHLFLFGSLIGLLGFEGNSKLCNFIDMEKKILRILAVKNKIEYTNFEMFHSFMYETNDDLASTNKDYLLNDYLSMQYNIITKSNYDISLKMKFKLILDRIMSYLKSVYKYLFNMKEDKEIYKAFYKLNKDCNLDNANKLQYLSEFELSLINFLIVYNSIATKKNAHERLPDYIITQITQILVLYVFKIVNDENLSTKIAMSRNVIELLSRTTNELENMYKENMINYAKFLIEFYTFWGIPINLDSPFKKFEIGNTILIKSEENPNYLKILLAKLIKNFSKSNLSFILKIIIDEFKSNRSDYSYFPFLIEILWLSFRDRSAKLIQYLPTVIGLIMMTMNPENRDLKTMCLEYSKKVLSNLIVNFPMIAFHTGSQKLAVGSEDGKIFIYDMNSGNIWKNLSAHSEEISALSFDLSGNIIVSYCASERNVKCWKIGLTNFFSNFFSMKDGYYKLHSFGKIPKEVSAEEKLKIVKFQTVKQKEHEIILIRENKSVEMLKI